MMAGGSQSMRNTVAVESRRCCLLLAALLSSTALPAAAQEAPTVLDPVTVIGERREQSLQRALSSVSVTSEEEIVRRPNTDVFSVLQGVPNLTAPTAVGAPAIRGMETSGAGGLPSGVTQGTLPRAPLIVDEIARPAALANTSFTSLWDVEQVEVLRGPQSTLRGRNAIAGAFVVKTKDPAFETEAAARAGLSFDEFGGPNYTAAGMVSGGVVKDRLALRLTTEHEGGHAPMTITNVPAGVDGDKQTRFDQTRIRAKALLTPGGAAEDLQVMAIGEVQTGTVPANRHTVVGPPINRREFQDRTYPYGTSGGQRVFDTLAWTTAIDATYWLGENSRLRSITSYVRDHYESANRQSDPTIFHVTEQLFNQDLLYEFGSETSGTSGLIGLNASERWQDIDVRRLTTASGRSSSQALFADLRHRLGERVQVVAGARLNRNVDDRDQLSLVRAASTSYDKTEITFLPKLGVSYDLDPNQTVGATARRGYNPGGGSVNFFTGQPYTFDSERVWTFETAYRSQWLDGRATLNVTAFYNLHDDPQLYIQRAAGNLTSLEVVNAPEGRSYGLEVEASARVAPSLMLTAGVGLLRTEVTEAPTGNPAIDGNRFGRDPSFTGSVGAVWTPLPGLSMDGRVSYVSGYYSDVNNLSAERVGDYVLVDAGVSYTYGSLTTRLYVNNLTDELAYTRRISNNYADLTPPRTVGVEATVRF